MKISKTRKSRIVEYLLFSIILILGIIFIFAIPPFQKTDEIAHFMRGVGLSNKGIVCKEDAKGNYYFDVEKKYLEYVKEVGANRIAFNYNEKFFFNKLKNEKERPESNEVIPYYGFCSLPFLAYIPTAIAVLIGNLTKAVSLSFYLSRIINFVIFFVGLLWSYNKIKTSKLRWILIAYGMVPMVVHQASTIGYDALQLIIAPILFALNISFIEGKKISRKDLWAYFILMSILLASKAGYYFLSLLYFLIPREKIAKDKKKYILYTFVYFLLCIIPLMLQAKLSGASGFINESRNVNATEQFRYLLEHPLFLIPLVRDTLGGNIYFYIGSFIGYFGWLDYAISPVIYLLFILSWTLLIGQIKKEQNHDKLETRILILGISIFLTISSIFGVMYLAWTPVAGRIIEGIQGRYFLVLFPFLMLFGVYFSKLFESKKLLRTILLSLFVLYVLFELSYVIYKRYYDYSYIHRESNYNMMVKRKIFNGYEVLGLKRNIS